MNQVISMNVHLAKSAGFCFGVKRAIKIAGALAEKDGEIRMLGDLVHNETVIREMESAGIKKIKRLGNGKNKTLLIRAHGVSNDITLRARKRGYRIVDVTCPMVREIHKIVKRMDRQGYRIIVIGDRQHDEVLGIMGQIKRKALAIDSADTIPWNAVRRIKKAAIVVQSTQNLDRAMQIANILKAEMGVVRFFNTICKPTRMKQEEIKTMPLKHDVMIIIGSRTSANTKRLYEISKSLNPRSFWIQDAEEINPQWFRNAVSVGVSAGASTPKSIMQAVMEDIARISS